MNGSPVGSALGCSIGGWGLSKLPDADAYERANYMLMLQGWRA